MLFRPKLIRKIMLFDRNCPGNQDFQQKLSWKPGCSITLFKTSWFPTKLDPEIIFFRTKMTWAACLSIKFDPDVINQHCFGNHICRPKLIRKSCISTKIVPEIISFGENSAGNRAWRSKSNRKSYFSTTLTWNSSGSMKNELEIVLSMKHGPTIMSFDDKSARNHAFGPNLIWQ